MTLLALLACAARLEGRVEDGNGAPVVGARLDATGLQGAACAAVSGADGAWATQCPRGSWTFAVTHPDHVPGTLDVKADASRVTVPPARLVRIPSEAGAWWFADGAFAPLDGVQLQRSEDATTQRWCVPDGETPRSAGEGTRVLRNDASGETWRMYRLDAERCAYRMTKGAAEHWSFTADRVEVPEVPDTASGASASGRHWLDPAGLPPGDYVLAPWVEGMFVREDPATDRWRGTWVRVP